MQNGKFNVLIDAMWGSSGKGKMSAWLTDKFCVNHVSSSNFPNAGHTFKMGDFKFMAKAIPTSMALRKAKGISVEGWLSPASGIPANEKMKLDRLAIEWLSAGRPEMFIHSRASIVTPEHARRESSGPGSTKHIASTMQGCSAAMIDKILRKDNVMLAGSKSIEEWMEFEDPDTLDEFISKVRILDGMHFRSSSQRLMQQGNTWLHEGSQGYALSIDHGSSYPASTSRNCTAQKAMDDMAVPASMVGDVYLNLRAHPIRVGNIEENGVQTGYSGDFYPDCKEMTWSQVAQEAGMPKEEADALSMRELTTVTKRVRRVCSFSWSGLEDAVASNGATKISLNFVQYLDWRDHGLRGGKNEFKNLSKKTREFINKIEEVANVPVVLIGTGADHEDVISLL